MAEKLPRQSKSLCHIRADGRRFLKRRQARQDRAAARRDPEAAPVRRAYSGWAD